MKGIRDEHYAYLRWKILEEILRHVLDSLTRVLVPLRENKLALEFEKLEYHIFLKKDLILVIGYDLERNPSFDIEDK